MWVRPSIYILLAHQEFFKKINYILQYVLKKSYWVEGQTINYVLSKEQTIISHLEIKYLHLEIGKTIPDLNPKNRPMPKLTYKTLI